MSEGSPAPAAAEDSALSFDQGVDALSNLDLDPAEKPSLPEDQDENAEPNAQSGDEPEGDDGEAPVDDDSADEEDPDGPGYDKGKFAADTAKVTLKDGTTLSVADLKRSYFSQRDFYRQTDEHKARVQETEAAREKVGEVALQIAAQRDFLLQVMPKYGPQPPNKAKLDPNSPEFDPVGFSMEKEAFEEASRDYGQMHAAREADKQRAESEQAERLHSYKAEPQKLLFEKIPEFKKPEVYRQFWTDANDIMVKHYGYTPEELAGAADHRYYRVMRDIVRLHKATTKAPQVTAQMQQKPALLRGGKRDTGQNISREAQSRKETLRKTGSFEAGVAALLNFKNL